MNLDMTDSMGPGNLVRHMQNPSFTYDEYLICIGLGPSISSVICKNQLYSGPSYPSSPVRVQSTTMWQVDVVVNTLGCRAGVPISKPGGGTEKHCSLFMCFRWLKIINPFLVTI